jgi:general secretion pathway protein F
MAPPPTVDLLVADRQGRAQRLVVAHDELAQRLIALRAQGLRVLNPPPTQATPARAGASTPAWWRIRVERSPAPDSALFAERLLALLQAGLSASEAISVMQRQAAGPEQTWLARLSAELSGGSTLAQALGSLAGTPALLVELVRASERTSDLPAALTEYVEYVRRTGEIKHRITAAAIYPVLLLAVGAAVLAFLLLYVMPRFAGVYAGLQGPLPLGVQVVLAWSAWTKAAGAWLWAGVLALALGVAGAATHAPTRQSALAWVLARTRWWRHYEQFHLARLYRTLGMLLAGGIPFPQAMRLSQGLLPVHLRLPGEAALVAVLQGEAPAQAFGTAGLATPAAEQLMQVGERTGQLGTMLLKAAAYHEQEVARQVERALKAAEPLLMACLGISIGAVVVLMYVPVFELAQALR